MLTVRRYRVSTTEHAGGARCSRRHRWRARFPGTWEPSVSGTAAVKGDVHGAGPIDATRCGHRAGVDDREHERRCGVAGGGDIGQDRDVDRWRYRVANRRHGFEVDRLDYQLREPHPRAVRVGAIRGHRDGHAHRTGGAWRQRGRFTSPRRPRATRRRLRWQTWFQPEGCR